jgi:hypothetical protein
MKATKYDPRNNHKETCVFEEWKPVERKMGYCGKPAVNLRLEISASSLVVKNTLRMPQTITNAMCSKSG